VLVFFRLSLAALKQLIADSDSVIFSEEGRPAVSVSRGPIMRLQPLMTLLRALNVPINDLKPLIVFGTSALMRGEIWWEEADKVPRFQIHPRIVVERGSITVFPADKRRSLSLIRCRT
jgi:hypothetical protein